jgi:hypothetical protein
MNKHAAKTLRAMRDNIDRHWCEEDITSILSDAQESYQCIPEPQREGEKAEALAREIARLEELLDAYQQMADAFASLRIDQGEIA